MQRGPLRRGTPEKTGTGGGPCAWVGSASLPFSSILTRCTGDLAKVRVCCSFHFSMNHLLTLQLSSLPSSLIIPGYLPLRLLKQPNMENLPLNILKNHDLLRFPNGICCWICVFSSLRYFRRSFKKSDFSALELPTRPSFSNSQPIQAYLLTHSFMALQWNWLGGRLTILRNRFIRVTKFHTNVPIRCP